MGRLFSGGLFGYDQGVISGALHGIKGTFSLSALLVEVVTSWVTLGALLGALAAGELADQIGRKRTVLIAGAMFTLGAVVQVLAPNTVVLVAGRLIGAGVGVAAVAAPLYAAELAPTTLRGRFVSAYQLAITIGIFLAYLIDGWLSKGDAWRIMLGAAAVPGLLLIAVALVAPRSPRWLMKMGRRSDAAQRYKVEPYVVCADLYSTPPMSGAADGPGIPVRPDGCTAPASNDPWVPLQGASLLIDPAYQERGPVSDRFRYRSSRYDIESRTRKASAEGRARGARRGAADRKRTTVPLADDGGPTAYWSYSDDDRGRTAERDTARK